MKRILIFLVLLAVTSPVEADRRALLMSKRTTAAAGYTASSASFDGANDRIQFSSSAVTFSGTGTSITISGWVNPGADGTAQTLVQGRSGTSGSQWYVQRTTTERLRFFFQDSTPTTIIDISSPIDVAEAADGWVHFYFTANTATGTDDWDLWINGVDVSGTSTETTFTTDGVLAGDRTNLNIGADDSNGGDVNGYIAELWIDDAYHAADSATVLKFYTGGNPVDLGSDGSTPFGSAPDLYMRFISGSLGVNSGADGGTATVTGAIDGPTFP